MTKGIEPGVKTLVGERSSWVSLYRRPKVVLGLTMGVHPLTTARRPGEKETTDRSVQRSSEQSHPSTTRVVFDTRV